VALALGAFEAASRALPGLDPSGPLVTYEVALIAVAIAFPIAMTAVLAYGARLADRLLGNQRLVGLAGLETVLADALHDPEVRIYRWHDSGHQYVDDRGTCADTSDDSRRWLQVDEGSDRLGVVAHSRALDDSMTSAAVSSAVRLAVLHLRLQERLQAQLVDLAAARSRIMAAGDQQRSATMTRLRNQVLDRLERATSEVRTVASSSSEAPAREALTVVMEQLSATAGEVMELVDGAPPALLGHGRLGEVLAVLAGRSPVPVTVTVSPDAYGDTAAESTLY
jgi:hypothetical protein